MEDFIYTYPPKLRTLDTMFRRYFEKQTDTLYAIWLHDDEPKEPKTVKGMLKLLYLDEYQQVIQELVEAGLITATVDDRALIIELI